MQINLCLTAVVATGEGEDRVTKPDSSIALDHTLYTLYTKIKNGTHRVMYTIHKVTHTIK